MKIFNKHIQSIPKVIGIISILIGTILTGCSGDKKESNLVDIVNTADETPLVKDSIKPSITLIGKKILTLHQNTLYHDAGAVAYDNKDGNITQNILIHNPVNTAIVGTYTVTYDVNDSAGNMAIQKKREVEIINISPTITGVPKTTFDQYSTYQFIPKSSDPSGNTLSFSIKNKPIWATFNTNTGELYGVPTKVEKYSDIIISVNNGFTTENLKSFDIDILPAQNIAPLFGQATQGDMWTHHYARYAIDENITTYNHADDSPPNNWWQLKLPEGVKIHRVVIQNSHRSYRLNNAKMYFNDTNHTANSTNMGTVNKILKGDEVQVFTYDPPIEKSYILMQGNIEASGGDKSLHMSEVKVYGELPIMPNYHIQFFQKYYKFGLNLHAKVGTKVGTVRVMNYAKKNLTYSILGKVPFSINSSGEINLTSILNHNQVQGYHFQVQVNDGRVNRVVEVEIKLLSVNGVKQRRWNEIDGGRVSQLLNSVQYQENDPDEIKIVNDFDMYENRGDKFGQIMSTILKPSVSGEYIFAIIGDDGTQLSLNGTKIASKWGWGSYQDWDNAGISNSMMLSAGEIYPMKAILKELGGAEHISVAWRKIDEKKFTVIPENLLFIETLTSKNVKPIFAKHDTKITLTNNNNGIGDKVLLTMANDSQGDSLTYSIIGDTPFTIDDNGQITISGSLEIKTYSFDVQVSDGVHTSITHLNITSTSNTTDLNSAKDDFYAKAKAFTKDSNIDVLIESYLTYAHIKAQFIYDTFMREAVDSDIWDYIDTNPMIKEGLYASRFPVNPYSVKNLAEFRKKWKEDGKDHDFIEMYKNVALGLSINARESGIFKELFFGDTSEHPTIDYSRLSNYEEKEKRWKEYFDFKNLGYGISYYDFRNYMKIKYQLSYSESSAIWSISSALKHIINDGKSIDDITPQIRKQYKLSFDGLNVYRLSQGLNRVNCFDEGNPCQKIEAYIANENNDTLTKNYILAHFSEYKSKIGLINIQDNFSWSLRGELGLVPKEKNDYKLMSFYDLASLKISNDQIPTKNFGDSEPNWPIFKSKLSTLPWQILALEQSAQKQECRYVKNRFFEVDKAELRASYPPHAIDGGKGAERRFKEYTTYTWAYESPEVIYSSSDWSSNRTVYRILQDGGVCGRQSTMGQHVNECLSRPSIGIGQPGHRAWVGVYNNSDNAKQYQTNIGYQVGSRESATAHSKLIYNQYTHTIRQTGLERFTGVVSGVSPASVGEHIYNQSMICQHIGKLLERDGFSSEAILKKSVELAPQNVDGWYQLALYYASLDQPKKIIDLAKKFMEKREHFFLDVDSRKGAENMEIVTGKNIVFIALQAPSINGGIGEKSTWGEKEIWAYLNKYESENRSLRSYRNQNRYLAKRYLEKEQNEDGFSDAIVTLFEQFLNEGSSGNYRDYFKKVSFKNIDKVALFDRLQSLTDQAQIDEKKRNKIYKDILGRSRSLVLDNIIVDDICLESNITSCQSIQSFELDAKEVYLTVNAHIGEDKEVDPIKRGIKGYSTLMVPSIDDLGKELNIKVRIAKVVTPNGISGKLLKINDPSEVLTDKTKIIVWIDPADNSLEKGRRYKAQHRLILKVKKRVTNNEEFMGDVILNIKNLIRGHDDMVFDGNALQSQIYKDDSTSVYFRVLNSNIGATSGVWAEDGYSILSIAVKDDNGTEKLLKLRATNNKNWKMNSGLNANWDNTLKIIYESKDNPTLLSGEHYKGLVPLTIDARMWHHEDKVKDRMYIKIDMLTP